MIQVFKPSVGREEIEAVSEVLKSGWLGLGPKTAEFEEEFAKYVGAKYAIGVNSGTAALHLALKVLGVGEGDEVLVPPITFVSTVHAVLYCGAKPVFVDVDEDTLNISVEDITRKITKRTRVILPVHYAGHPCEMDEIMDIARKEGIYVVEDAAHACGAEYKGRKIGSIGDLTCFSFHAVKNLSCGEGGMITTNNASWAERLHKLRWLGINKDTWERSIAKGAEKATYAWQYSVEELGFKYHMHDISAAIGLVQLKKLGKNNQKRHEIFLRYNEAFAGLDWLGTPVEKGHVQSSHHIYAVKVERRDDLIAHLKKNGVGPGVHYFPIHLHPYYKGYDSEVPLAESVWQKLLSLPMYPDLGEDEIKVVIKVVRDFSD